MPKRRETFVRSLARSLLRQDPTAFGDDLVLVLLDQRAQAACLGGFGDGQLGRVGEPVDLFLVSWLGPPYSSMSKAVTGLIVSLSIT